jgi:large subunit ribosomal protein L9
MKVIIKKDNTIKDVSEGYFQNYLLPRGLATIATPQELKKRDELLNTKEIERKQQLIKDEKLLNELDGKEYTILTSKIGNNNKLFGSITAKEISEQTQINKVYIQLETPIKEAGSHVIPLKIGQFHGRITITIAKGGAA